MVLGLIVNIFFLLIVVVENLEFLGIDNLLLGDLIIYLLNNFLFFGFNVSEKVRRDIWVDNYVDLIYLLLNFND